MIFGTDEKEVKSMETVKIKKSINWKKLLGEDPKIKNRKEIRFFNGLGEIDYLTKIIKVKIDNQEYVMSYYNSYEVEEIEIKNNRAVLLLSLKYDKKNDEGYKKVNYEFAEVIVYFLFEFFKDRLEKDQDFQAIMKELDKYQEFSLEISESVI